jgi:hypothetical protein
MSTPSAKPAIAPAHPNAVPPPIRPTAPVVQTSLPATAPTALPAPAPSTAPVSTTLPVDDRPTRRAEVKYSAGLLSVAADNSSLNQILRDISRQTGMKIAGGVVDEHVFGNYGPDAPRAILATLLDGTGSNFLLVQNDTPAPTELILTPRQGGPTPPNPNAAGFNDAAEYPQPASMPEQTRPRPPAPLPSPAQSAAFPNLNQPANDTSPDPNTKPDTPTGPKTPQQIYEELQRLRNQTPATPQ